jgi:hypothetical protein
MSCRPSTSTDLEAPLKSSTRSFGAKRGLFPPVEDDRSGHDDQRRALRLLLRPQPIQPRQHHHGLAEPHVVGEAPAEPEPPEEREPSERIALVVAKLADERRRGVQRRDAFEGRELVARARETLVDANGRVQRQRRVQQGDLRHLEPHVVAGRFPTPAIPAQFRATPPARSPSSRRRA